MIVHLPIGLFPDSGASGPGLSDVVWDTNLKNVGVTGNNIFRNAGIWGAGEGGGSSSIGLTGDGEFTFEIGAVPYYRFIGLALSDDDWLWDDADVRFRFTSSNICSAQMLGQSSQNLTNYGAGETYRITRVDGDTIQWWRNYNLGGGWEKERELTGTGLTGTLYPDVALYDQNNSDCLNATILGDLA